MIEDLAGKNGSSLIVHALHAQLGKLGPILVFKFFPNNAPTKLPISLNFYIINSLISFKLALGDDAFKLIEQVWVELNK